jgi:phospho-N-acetylmuramoyl-pentapeptide-transferase
MIGLLVTAGIAFMLGLAFQKLWIFVLAKWRMKQIIREDGPEAHKKKTGTLTMGGVAFYAASMVALLVMTGFSDPKVKIVVIVSSICFLIGLVDDLAKFYGKKTEGVKARYKLIIEIALGVFIGLFMVWSAQNPGMIWAPRWFGGLNLGWLFVPFAVVVFVGTINAANLTDGLDGLLAGCYLIVGAAFLYFINRYGDRSLLPVLAATIGAVAAFLWFNSNPARIFMGDTGSLFIGGVLATIAIVARAEFFLFVAGGVLAAETLSVVLQVVSFRLTKKRIFRMSPLHHHFELSGWSETQVVIRFWIAAAVCAAAGLLMFIR